MATTPAIRWIWVACVVVGAVVVVLAATLLAGTRAAAPPPPPEVATPDAPRAIGLGAPLTVPVGEHPSGLAPTPDGSRVLVTNVDGLLVLDAETGEKVSTIANQYGFHGLLISPDGKRAYSWSGFAITPIDLLTGLIGDPIASGTDGVPFELGAISADGSTLSGTINDTAGIAIGLVDLASGTSRRIPLPAGSSTQGAVITADGSRAYVADETSGITNPLQVVDLATGVVTAVPGTEGTIYMGLSQDGRFLHAMGFSKALVLDPATGAVLRERSTSLVQGKVVPLPGGRHHLIVGVTDGQVQLFDMESGNVGAGVTIGGFVRDVALAPDGSKLYVISDAGLTVIPVTGGG